MILQLIDGIVGKGRKIMCAAKRLNKDERKKEIMNAAAKIIISKGFEKTTMEEIVARTSLSKGGVYHYYGSVLDIFKDLMLHGIDYRDEVIKKHLHESKNSATKEFFAKELVNKIIDDNPYMPLYIEFMIAKKRNPELDSLMLELQERTKKKLKTFTDEEPEWLEDANIFQFVTDFLNAMILASDVLNARETFTKNRHLLEKMIICLFENI